MREDDNGFTLIELIVVVIIVSILSAVAIPSYLAQRESAHLANVKHDLHTAQVAVESTAISNNGSYLSLDGLTHESATLAAAGYEGSQTTHLRILATNATYCIEGFDVRGSALLVVRSDIAGVVAQSSGC